MAYVSAKLKEDFGITKQASFLKKDYLKDETVNNKLLNAVSFLANQVIKNKGIPIEEASLGNKVSIKKFNEFLDDALKLIENYHHVKPWNISARNSYLVQMTGIKSFTIFKKRV